ncbi:inositol monophosphatase family protein [Lysobacter korlensis]|uniref:Inositol-1-monophosphatase n=1 Tax=Lysobacter korlensis TaxID=553636 RepID=A0ABV6RSP5_9GAMM
MNGELLDLARNVAVEAGELARRLRGEGVEVADTKSTVTDIVTFADRQTEELIRGRLADARPNDGFLGEESGAERGTSGLTWVVDPIDGTVNYAYGLPFYAVSIAVVEGEPDPLTWRALAGCVVNPVGGEVFTAAEGDGAHLGGERISVAPSVAPDQALLATGFSYTPERRTAQASALARYIASVRDIRRIGVAALDLCYVAAGRLNAYAESGLHPWDQAAGVLIAREAGARVTGWDGGEPSREFLLAAEPRLAEQLEKILAEYRG